MCLCGCVSEMGMSGCPRSYNLRVQGCVRGLCLRGYNCVLTTECEYALRAIGAAHALSMPFAPKEEGHFLSPGQRQGFADACCQRQPTGLHT